MKSWTMFMFGVGRKKKKENIKLHPTQELDFKI